MTDTVRCGPVVIGAGAIGLSIANTLSKAYDNVIVLELESGPGHHTSSRNSEVIHSGIYYPQNGLKSQLCLSGKTLLYSFLAERNIPFRRCGKLIVATDDEMPCLEELEKNASNLDIAYEVLSENYAAAREPLLNAAAALFIPDTGYFDSHSFMRSLQGSILDSGGWISYNSAVSEIIKSGNEWEIVVNNGALKVNTNTIINSAGLCADKVASMAGFTNYKIFFYKGEYYKCSKIKNLKHLIYSVPPANQLSLGIHTRHYLDGTIGFGPNAYPINTIDYTIDDSKKEEFLYDIRKYININLLDDDLWPDYSGIRPKIQGGGFGADFIIKNEQCDGDRVMINLVGIESPGLTCSLSIADRVAKMLQEHIS